MKSSIVDKEELNNLAKTISELVFALYVFNVFTQRLLSNYTCTGQTGEVHQRSFGNHLAY